MPAPLTLGVAGPCRRRADSLLPRRGSTRSAPSVRASSEPTPRRVQWPAPCAPSGPMRTLMRWPPNPTRTSESRTSSSQTSTPLRQQGRQEGKDRAGPAQGHHLADGLHEGADQKAHREEVDDQVLLRRRDPAPKRVEHQGPDLRLPRRGDREPSHAKGPVHGQAGGRAGARKEDGEHPAALGPGACRN